MTTPLPKFSDLGGTVRKIMRYPVETDNAWSAFNPSIAQAPDGSYAMIVRSSNYFLREDNGVTTVLQGGYIRNRNWFYTLDEDLNITSGVEIKFNHKSWNTDRGVEDGRLFWRDGGWKFTAVMFDPTHTPYARLCIYEYDVELNQAILIERLAAPVETRTEKNWLPPSAPNPEFDFVYSGTQIWKDDVVQTVQPSGYPALLDDLRGNTPLLLQDDGSYLAVLHTVFVRMEMRYIPTTFSVEPVWQRDYEHYFARFDRGGKIVELSPPFLFTSTGIEYAAGLVKSGSDLHISYGKKDLASFIATIPEENVINLLQPVETFS